MAQQVKYPMVSLQWLRSRCGSGFIPGPEISTCHKCGKKKKKNRKELKGIYRGVTSVMTSNSIPSLGVIFNTEMEQDPVGCSLVHIFYLSPISYLQGKGFSSLMFPEFQRANSKSC